jgi:hypothetical protein
VKMNASLRVFVMNLFGILAMAQNRPTATAPLPDQIYIRHVIVINTETGEEIQETGRSSFPVIESQR